jgi:hypothetical protein
VLISRRTYRVFHVFPWPVFHSFAGSSETARAERGAGPRRTFDSELDADIIDVPGIYWGLATLHRGCRLVFVRAQLGGVREASNLASSSGVELPSKWTLPWFKSSMRYSLASMWAWYGHGRGAGLKDGRRHSFVSATPSCSCGSSVRRCSLSSRATPFCPGTPFVFGFSPPLHLEERPIVDSEA